MTTQPEALMLADELEFHGRYGYETEEQSARRRVHRNTKAAAELRRQHERIKELEAENERLSSHMANLRNLHAKRIDKLEAALDVAQKDAARYRWIRDHDTMNETEGLIYRAQGDKAQIDAEIDERIKEVRK